MIFWHFPRFLLAACDNLRSAERRGMELLLSHLSSTQLAQFKSAGCFDVTGNDSGCRYRIRDARSINVEQLGLDGQCVRRWCFEPKGNLVRGDVMLAQKFALECFEREALQRGHDYPPEQLDTASNNKRLG